MNISDDTPDIIATNGSQLSDDEEELTASEVLLRLETAWLNEKFAPNLLPSEDEVVNCMIDQIKQMETNLAKLEKRDFRIPVHQMELARVKFLISNYLRIRIDKIQKNVHFILENDDEMAKLTSNEKKYVKNYSDNLETLFKKLALNHMPGSGDFRSLNPRKADPKLAHPDLSASVFIKANQDCTGVLIEDETNQGRDEEVDIDAGSQHILPYKSVESLITNGKLSLI